MAKESLKDKFPEKLSSATLPKMLKKLYYQTETEQLIVMKVYILQILTLKIF